MAFSPQKAMKRLWKKYIRRCRDKNIYWEIPVELFEKLTSNACVYCGTAPAQKTRGYLYNGLDRKNNDQGYYPDNVVPACGLCNGIKSDKISYEEMLHIGKWLVEFRNKNKKQK